MPIILILNSITEYKLKKYLIGKIIYFLKNLITPKHKLEMRLKISQNYKLYLFFQNLTN